MYSIIMPIGFIATAGVMGTAAVAGGAYMLSQALKTPDMPKPPKPEPMVSTGEEDIRRKVIKTDLAKKQKALYLTQGARSDNTSLGAYRQTLG